MKKNVKENALVLRYSKDKLQLVSHDGKVFAYKENASDYFKIAIPNDPAAYELKDTEDPKPKEDPTPKEDPKPKEGHYVKVRVCIGTDDNGKCTGWTFELVWEY